MKIKTSWLFAAALWVCLILGFVLYVYGNSRVAMVFDVSFVLLLDSVALISWINWRLRRARGLPYKPSWWDRFAIDADYNQSIARKIQAGSLTIPVNASRAQK